MRYDAVIIGGGAAGLCAAVRLKQNNSKLSVAIAEQLPRVGKKLITTGNGRCNITNREPSPSRYHGEHPEFCIPALTAYNTAVTEDFFSSLGVLFTYDEVGRAYPYSLQAAAVVDALRFAADAAGVVTLTESRVTDLRRENGGYTLTTSGGVIAARCVLVATGLYSGGEKLGSDGSMLRLLRQHGYRTVKTTPAIVQIKTDPQTVRSLKGIKVNADAALLCNGKTVRREYGEVLFCDYGLSGPPILQISRGVERLNGELTVSLDLMPEYDFAALSALLTRRIARLANRPIEEFFTGMLNKRVGQAVLKSCGYKMTDCVSSFGGGTAKQLAAAIKAMRFRVTGTTGFLNSQVTAGGLATDDFDAETMMSRRDAGLFAAGEILDIDGDCGGFNLQWAWSGALCAADHIFTYLGGKNAAD